MNSAGLMPMTERTWLMLGMVASPTPIRGTSGDSTSVMSTRPRGSPRSAASRYAAAIQPAEPPPTIRTLLLKRSEVHRHADEETTPERFVNRAAARAEVRRSIRDDRRGRNREPRIVRIAAHERRVLVQQVLDAEGEHVLVAERETSARVEQLIAGVDVAERVRRTGQTFRISGVQQRGPELMSERRGPGAGGVAHRREQAIVVLLALDLQCT